MVTKHPALIHIENTHGLKLHNHLEDSFHLNNKKALLYNLKYYCECMNEDLNGYIPLTFHIITDKTPEY